MLVCYDLPTRPYPPNTRYRVLTQAWSTSVTLRDQVFGLTVPKGFVWDGASVPSAVRWLIGDPFDCRFQRASLIHDYLYWSHKATRADADEIFRQLLIASGASRYLAGVMYAAVRVAAQSNYDDRKAGEFKIAD